jgi:hypothetical protein
MSCIARSTRNLSLGVVDDSQYGHRCYKRGHDKTARVCSAPFVNGVNCMKSRSVLLVMLRKGPIRQLS